MTQLPLLHIVTIGSVDDGKSTLIGHLLYETKSIYEDQFEAIKKVSLKKGTNVDLSLLLDGLSAEREQAITIDVAYRYFSTNKRKFIIADCPGHEQYTRNMATGASTADLAILLIDARKGILQQSKRHAFIVSLLGIKYVLVAVNKMDLIGYSEGVFEEIVLEYSKFSEKLNIPDIKFIPISALRGDNIVKSSPSMSWYKGGTVLRYLENVNIIDRGLTEFRFPVQYVIRPNMGFRGFSGLISAGQINVNDEIKIYPSEKEGKIKSIITYDGELSQAKMGDSVVIILNKELDISRGDLIAPKKNSLQVYNKFEANLCWMGDAPLNIEANYILKHTTRYVKAFIKNIRKIDIDTLHQSQDKNFSLNDIGLVEINTSQKIFFDPYKISRSTGSFILINPITNATVAAGMILNPLSDYIEKNKRETLTDSFKKAVDKATKKSFDGSVIQEYTSRALDQYFLGKAADCTGDIITLSTKDLFKWLKYAVISFAFLALEENTVDVIMKKKFLKRAQFYKSKYTMIAWRSSELQKILDGI